MLKSLTHLGDMPIATFLAEYWQKKPVLIRNACTDSVPSIAPETLAGLSLEDEVASRLIENQGDASQWRVFHGPLLNEHFAKNRDYPWTLLVQGVDNYLPEAYEFLTAFRFIPAWRLDDLMVSYATKHASVGAHYDRYDVFLVQGEGRRRWQLGQRCSVTSSLLPNSDLHLLNHFNAQASYDLATGDLLYIPPFIAHQGVALSEHCLTYSVGFRAPSYGEVWQAFGDYQSDALSVDHRLTNLIQNPTHSSIQRPAQIAMDDIKHLQSVMMEQLSTDNIAQWFGQFASSGKHTIDTHLPCDERMDKEELIDIIEAGDGVCRVAEDARCLYVKTSTQALHLFANGHSIHCDDDAAPLAVFLADQLVIATAKLSDYLLLPKQKPRAIDLFLQLYNEGIIYFDNHQDNA